MFSKDDKQLRELTWTKEKKRTGKEHIRENANAVFKQAVMNFKAMVLLHGPWYDHVSQNKYMREAWNDAYTQLGDNDETIKAPIDVEARSVCNILLIMISN